jgi:energy-coupling factor transporter ATP-binding protein EcfA2
MVKLKRLKIDKFRNVAPGTELHFRDSLNVLLGKNGTGKTTLLNLIVAVLSGRFAAFREEAFGLEYELTAPQGAVTVRVENRLVGPEFSPQDERGMAGSEPPISYMSATIALGGVPRYSTSCEARFHLAESSGNYRLTVEGTQWVLRESASEVLRVPLGGPLLEYSLMADAMMWIKLWGEKNPSLPSMPALVTLVTALREEGLDSIQRFDESLSYLDELMRSKSLFVGLQVLGRFAVVASKGKAASITQRLAEGLAVQPPVDRLVMRDQEAGMEFLARAVHLLNFSSGEVRIQRTARNAGPPERADFGDLQFYFVRKDGSEIDGSRLSYGQKRLLSFYYYLDCSAACAVADELVNGMHHEWIEACLEDLGERQAFLTSQNPLLLDYLGFESSEEVRSSFVLCTSQLQGGREQLRWENMTPEDAEGFFQAYRVGIQHVSEILRTRGLW